VQLLAERRELGDGGPQQRLRVAERRALGDVEEREGRAAAVLQRREADLQRRAGDLVGDTGEGAAAGEDAQALVGERIARPARVGAEIGDRPVAGEHDGPPVVDDDLRHRTRPQRLAGEGHGSGGGAFDHET
jgi:hypothetical protein